MHGVRSTRTQNAKPKFYDKPKITTLPPDKTQPAPEVGDVITHTDSKTGVSVTYKKGKFLGKVYFITTLLSTFTANQIRTLWAVTIHHFVPTVTVSVCFVCSRL